MTYDELREAAITAAKRMREGHRQSFAMMAPLADEGELWRAVKDAPSVLARYVLALHSEVQPETTAREVVYWRCFHCGEEFTQAQQKHAAEHFGADEFETPVCKMRVPGENSLLSALRSAQAELRTYRFREFESKEAEQLMRVIEEQSAHFAEKLLREEEKGYARGLRDGMSMKQVDSKVSG